MNLTYPSPTLWLPSGGSSKRTPDPFWMRRMPGYPCCCSKCVCPDGTRITADGTVTWITHEVDGGVITKVDNEGPCKTYWVDSVSGGGAETGSGTEEDPWTNLNTVFSDACIYFICTHSAAPDSCPKVKVLVKGTIDYVINGGSRNYLRNLVIEPWGGTVMISVSGSGTVYAVTRCLGVVWKSTNATGISNDSGAGAGNGYGFTFCEDSIFDGCAGTGETHGYSAGMGFYHCNYSILDSCTGTGLGHNTIASSSIGFGHSDQSTFDNCIGTATSNGSSSAYSYGFVFCDDSTFDTCGGTAIIVGTPTDGRTCGFRDNTRASFNNCTTSASACFGGGCPANCDI